jgi:hypothetical protein
MLNILKTYRSKANAKLIQALTAGRDVVDAKKADLNKTQALVDQAVSEARTTASALMGQLSATARDEGILFIDYQGIILHANQVAHKVLESGTDKLIGKSIEALLTPKARRVRHRIAECSKVLHDKLACKLDLPQIAEVCKQFSFTIASSTEIVLNEPIILPYHNGHLQVRLSLLDTSPSTIEDVTYLCRLAKAQ